MSFLNNSLWMRIMLFLCISQLGAQSSFGKMAMREAIAVSKIVSVFEQMETAGKKLSASQKSMLTMTKIAGGALQLKDIYVSGRTDDPSIRSMQAATLLRPVTDAIRKHPAWDHPAPKEAITLIRTNRSVWLDALGKDSYASAWFYYQLGEKSEAKKILANLYEKEYQWVLQQKTAVYGLGGSPLGRAQDYLKALEPMSDNASKAKLQSQMQKMKIHVSNLPESHIKT